MVAKNKLKAILNIEVGNEVISVVFGDEKLFALVRQIYLPFISNKQPHYLIKTEISRDWLAYNNSSKGEYKRKFQSSRVITRSKPEEFSAATPGFSLNPSAHIYTIEFNEFKGILDLKRKFGMLYLLSDFCSKEIFVSALTNLCMAIILNKGALVFHASGVVKKDKAYIFLGPSGAGKSTAAQTASGLPVLSEELIGIYPDGEDFTAFPLPYVGDSHFSARQTRDFRIAGLFRLIKDRSNYLKEITKSQAIADFLIIPAGLLRFISFSDYFKMHCNFIKTTPCYELHFLADGSFWRCIDECLN